MVDLRILITVNGSHASRNGGLSEPLRRQAHSSLFSVTGRSDGGSGGGIAMADSTIDAIVWRALTDAAFRERLLKGDRHQLVALYDLTELERDAVMALNDTTLDAFAGSICQWADTPPRAARRN